MSKTPSVSDERTPAPKYEPPALKEYGTLLELTLGSKGKGEKGALGGTTGGGSV